MDRSAFQQLLARYLDGICSPEEKQLVEQWYQLLEDENTPGVSDDQMKQAGARMWASVVAHTQTVASLSEEKKPARTRYLTWARAVAAAIVVAVVIIFYSKSDTNSREKILAHISSNTALQEITNTSSQNKPVWLKDSSRVILYPGAKISYPENFGHNREVYLEGDAFFEVKKIRGRSFYVYNKYVITQVLGTSFSITSPANRETVISVRTGRVAVYEHHNGQIAGRHDKKKNGVILTPNQKATYYSTDRHFITGLIESPQPLTATPDTAATKKFVFDETPMKQVITELQEAYGIEIIVDNDALYNCPFTGAISSQSLYDKLEMICTSIQASYEIEETKIILRGNGCSQ